MRKTVRAMSTTTRILLPPEEKRARLLASLESRTTDQQRPWMKHFGWAKDDALYDEAMQLGAEYRKKVNERLED